MGKKDLTGGVANLFAGATQSVKEKAVASTPEPEQTETAKEQTSLIDTIEDEELRSELERRLKEKRKVGRGRPRKNDQLGRRTDGYDRTSLIIPVEKWAKVKEIAFIETLTLKEIVELALDMVIDKYESKHGEVTPQPERQRKDIHDIF